MTLSPEKLSEALRWTDAAVKTGMMVEVNIAPVILEAARLYLAHLQGVEAGGVVVPREPTEDQGVLVCHYLGELPTPGNVRKHYGLIRRLIAAAQEKP